jgi:hypothetical protein
MKCKDCKHCQPIRGEIAHQCGHEAVAGLVRCDQCAGWHLAEQYSFQTTARKIKCPTCGGLSPVPSSDHNRLDSIGGRPDWCPGFAGEGPGQGMLF